MPIPHQQAAVLIESERVFDSKINRKIQYIQTGEGRLKLLSGLILVYHAFSFIVFLFDERSKVN